VWHELATPPADFAEATVPTLLVLGRHSKLVSAGELEAYRAALGEQLAVVVVPGGHLPLWDAFDETAAAVERFLS
jgi:pimeloyl-ACP methyl ester carboxylesterase